MAKKSEKSAKPRARKARPSFGGVPDTDAPSTGWVYRSDTTQAATVSAAPRPAPEPAAPSLSQKDHDATEIVRRHALYAAGAGLIPLPIVDFAAVSALALKMTAEIAAVYSVDFSADLARPIIASIIGSYAATRVGHAAGVTLVKAVPVIGPIVGSLSMPAFAAGVTWAIGKVFIMQFSSGGTFLDLDPERLRTFFASARA